MTYTKEDLRKLAIDVFGDKNKAEKWLATTIKALNGKAPNSIVDTAEGIEAIRAILRKIETGEFT